MKYLLSRTTGSKTPQSHECLQTPLGSSGRPRYLSDISLFLSALTTLCVNISLESFTTFRRLENTPIGQMCFLRPEKAPISFRYIALFVSVRHSNTHMTTSFKRHISRHTFDKQTEFLNQIQLKKSRNITHIYHLSSTFAKCRHLDFYLSKQWLVGIYIHKTTSLSLAIIPIFHDKTDQRRDICTNSAYTMIFYCVLWVLIGWLVNGHPISSCI